MQADLGIQLYKASGNAADVGAYLGDVMSKLETNASTLTVPDKEQGKVQSWRVLLLLSRQTRRVASV